MHSRRRGGGSLEASTGSPSSSCSALEGGSRGWSSSLFFISQRPPPSPDLSDRRRRRKRLASGAALLRGGCAGSVVGNEGPPAAPPANGSLPEGKLASLRTQNACEKGLPPNSAEFAIAEQSSDAAAAACARAAAAAAIESSALGLSRLGIGDAALLGDFCDQRISGAQNWVKTPPRRGGEEGTSGRRAVADSARLFCNRNLRAWKTLNAAVRRGGRESDLMRCLAGASVAGGSELLALHIRHFLSAPAEPLLQRRSREAATPAERRRQSARICKRRSLPALFAPPEETAALRESPPEGQGEEQRRARHRRSAGGRRRRGFLNPLSEVREQRLLPVSVLWASQELRTTSAESDELLWVQAPPPGWRCACSSRRPPKSRNRRRAFSCCFFQCAAARSRSRSVARPSTPFAVLADRASALGVRGAAEEQRGSGELVSVRFAASLVDGKEEGARAAEAQTAEESLPADCVWPAPAFEEEAGAGDAGFQKRISVRAPQRVRQQTRALSATAALRQECFEVEDFLRRLCAANKGEADCGGESLLSSVVAGSSALELHLTDAASKRLARRSVCGKFCPSAAGAEESLCLSALSRLLALPAFLLFADAADWLRLEAVSRTARLALRALPGRDAFMGLLFLLRRSRRLEFVKAPCASWLSRPNSAASLLCLHPTPANLTRPLKKADERLAPRGDLCAEPARLCGRRVQSLLERAARLSRPPRSAQSLLREQLLADCAWGRAPSLLHESALVSPPACLGDADGVSEAGVLLSPQVLRVIALGGGGRLQQQRLLTLDAANACRAYSLEGELQLLPRLRRFFLLHPWQADALGGGGVWTSALCALSCSPLAAPHCEHQQRLLAGQQSLLSATGKEAFPRSCGGASPLLALYDVAAESAWGRASLFREADVFSLPLEAEGDDGLGCEGQAGAASPFFPPEVLRPLWEVPIPKAGGTFVVDVTPLETETDGGASETQPLFGALLSSGAFCAVDLNRNNVSRESSAESLGDGLDGLLSRSRGGEGESDGERFSCSVSRASRRRVLRLRRAALGRLWTRRKTGP